MATRKTARSIPRKSARKSARKRVGPSAPKSRPAARQTAAKPSLPGRRSQRARKQPETLRLRTVAPALTCAELERSLGFYVGGLGFVVSQEWIRDGRRTGVMLRAGSCELALAQDDWAKGRDRVKGVGVRLYLETTQDVDALATRLAAAGFPLASAPQTTPWAARELSVDDPDGFHLTIYRAPAKGG